MDRHDGSSEMADKTLSFLMFRAIRGVIRSAEKGDLPLFARYSHLWCMRGKEGGVSC